jgi:hypothetical protein
MSGAKETPTPAQQGEDRAANRSDENGQPWNDPVDEQLAAQPRPAAEPKGEQSRSHHGEHSEIEPRH